MSFKSITTASSLSTAEINQLLDIASEMKRIVNSRVKRGPQLLGKSLAVLDFAIAKTSGKASRALGRWEQISLHF